MNRIDILLRKYKRELESLNNKLVVAKYNNDFADGVSCEDEANYQFDIAGKKLMLLNQKIEQVKLFILDLEL